MFPLLVLLQFRSPAHGAPLFCHAIYATTGLTLGEADALQCLLDFIQNRRVFYGGG